MRKLRRIIAEARDADNLEFFRALNSEARDAMKNESRGVE